MIRSSPRLPVRSASHAAPRTASSSTSIRPTDPHDQSNRFRNGRPLSRGAARFLLYPPHGIQVPRNVCPHARSKRQECRSCGKKCRGGLSPEPRFSGLNGGLLVGPRFAWRLSAPEIKHPGPGQTPVPQGTTRPTNRPPPCCAKLTSSPATNPSWPDSVSPPSRSRTLTCPIAP